jgi:hypothetical protein
MELIKDTEPLLDAREVRKLLKCSLPLVYKMADRGQLPCVRWPCPGQGEEKARTMVRFKREDIFKFIESNYYGNRG